jgi:probable HAF family extracellular repeat protein
MAQGRAASLHLLTIKKTGSRLIVTIGRKTMRLTKSTLLAATALGVFGFVPRAAAQTTPSAAVVFLPAPSPDTLPAQCRGSAVNPNTYAEGISADGRVVAGRASTSECVVLWRNGVPEVPNLGTVFFGSSISGDGRTTVGFNGVGGSNGGREYNVGVTNYWTATNGTQVMPTIQTLTAAEWNASPPIAVRSGSGAIARAYTNVILVPTGSAYVNGDGTFFAVNSAYRGGWEDALGGSALPFQFDGRVLRWSPTTGYQQLPTFGDGLGMWAEGIDGSGNRIAGTSYSNVLSPGNEYLSRAFLWDTTTGLSRLPDLAALFSNPSLVLQSASTGISRDGTVVIGYSRAVDGISHPVFWRGGAITDLGFLAGRAPTTADPFGVNFHSPLAASAGGNVIVGRVGSDCCNTATTTDRAWRWSATTGMQELQQIALNAGLNLNGFVLYEANGISDDAQFISGNAYNGSDNFRESGFVLQLAQVTQSRLIVTIRLPGVTQTSIVNQSFSTQVDGLLNGRNVFTRTVTDPITGAAGVTALADARAALQVGGGLRRVVIGAPTLVSNTTTVLGTTNATVDVASGTTTSTATVNTFGPATVATGNLGTCATPAANNTNPTGCSLPGTLVSIDAGILNSNVFTNTINSVTPTTTPTVNQLVSAKWQVSATAGNQFGTAHALSGVAAFDRGDRLIGQLLGMGGSDGSSGTDGIARAAMPRRDESGLGGGEGGLTMFGGYFGNWSRTDADASVPVARATGRTNGFVLGLEKALGDNAHLGVAVDHGNSNIQLRDATYPETLKFKQTQIGLFAGWAEGGFSLDGAVAYGFGKARTTIATPTTPALANRDVNSWSLGAQAGYRLPLGDDADVRLVTGIRHVSAKLKAFTEVGGPTPLAGGDENVHRTRIYGGLEAGVNIDLGGSALTPRAYTRIARDSGDARGSADLVFAATPNGPTLTAFGPGVGKTVAEIGGGFDLQISDNVTITAGYDGAFRNGSKVHAAKAGIRIAF